MWCFFCGRLDKVWHIPMREWYYIPRKNRIDNQIKWLWSWIGNKYVRLESASRADGEEGNFSTGNSFSQALRFVICEVTCVMCGLPCPRKKVLWDIFFTSSLKFQSRQKLIFMISFFLCDGQSFLKNRWLYVCSSWTKQNLCFFSFAHTRTQQQNGSNWKKEKHIL